MSTNQKLGQAIESLEAALQVAEKERDQAVFELARGVRSHGELMRLAERVALVRSLVVQARTLLPTAEAPQRHGQFRSGEHWQRGRVLYRVEPCPLIPSCVRLMPVANAQQHPIHRHRLNTIRFQRICP
jgi:hypothetical protein